MYDSPWIPRLQRNKMCISTAVKVKLAWLPCYMDRKFESNKEISKRDRNSQKR